MHLGKIYGFESRGEHQRFCTYLDGQIASGIVQEKSPDPTYQKGMIFGGRWFEDSATKEVWRLVPPDFPFRGLFEKIERP